MLSERELQSVWYGDRKPGFTLKVLSILFAMVSAARRRLYTSGVFGRVKLAVPVIVVGNISVGGTGKTPLVIALVDALRQRGFKPGIISRGFGGVAQDVAHVDDASDVKTVGDEARLIVGATHAPMVVGRDRVQAARALLDGGHVDVIVCDDGLQHYRLERDVEICVIDGQRRLGNGRLLPAGPLRETASRLQDVDVVVCNGSDAHSGEVIMRLRGDSAIALHDPSTSKPLSAFAGMRVHAVAGIGNPQRFFAQLRDAGIEVIEHAFPDHHAFVAADFAFGDDTQILMTEKDAVKCRAFARAGLWSVPVTAELPAHFFDTVALKLRADKSVDGKR